MHAHVGAYGSYDRRAKIWREMAGLHFNGRIIAVCCTAYRHVTLSTHSHVSGAGITRSIQSYCLRCENLTFACVARPKGLDPIVDVMIPLVCSGSCLRSRCAFLAVYTATKCRPWMSVVRVGCADPDAADATSCNLMQLVPQIDQNKDTSHAAKLNQPLTSLSC
jgi:hypothetical protein